MKAQIVTGIILIVIVGSIDECGNRSAYMRAQIARGAEVRCSTKDDCGECRAIIKSINSYTSGACISIDGMRYDYCSSTDNTDTCRQAIPTTSREHVDAGQPPEYPQSPSFNAL